MKTRRGISKTLNHCRREPNRQGLFSPSGRSFGLLQSRAAHAGRMTALMFLAMLAACAGPGPKLLSTAPLTSDRRADGWTQNTYDTDDDDHADYAECQAPDGRVVLLRYDLDCDGDFDLDVHRAGVGDAEAAAATPADILPSSEKQVVLPEDCRHLVILLDSIPYQLVQELREQGRFRLFHPPSRVISPFPVMTDVCFSDFFHVTPAVGVESQYYNGRWLNYGYAAYARGEVMAWSVNADYHLKFFAHSLAYPNPLPWYDHELCRIQKKFYDSEKSPFIGYCVGPSALGSRIGRNGHVAGLIHLDRLCQEIMHRTRGRVQITLMSDHGHNLVSSRRIPLSDVLEDCGYRLVRSLKRPGDVVVPEFGTVTYAGIHTSQPAVVARDVSAVEGVELVAYLDSEHDEVWVLARNARARITRRDGRYRYEPQIGDPLNLEAIWDGLREEGKLDAEGFVDDQALFEATANHEYPDPVHRLWRAFHGLVKCTPEVMVSVQDGWHCGSAMISNMIDLAAAHGNMRMLSSSSFVMSTLGRVDPVIRMENLRDALRKLGVPLEESRK